MRCQLTTDDGVRLKTSSRRRYAIFGVAQNGYTEVLEYADQEIMARRVHALYVGGRTTVRIITLDTLGHQILLDSAGAEAA